MVHGPRGAELSPAALPFEDMAHRIVVPLYRGESCLGALVVASHRKRLGARARHLVQRLTGHFATAVERINLRLERNELNRRLTTLARLTGQNAATMEGIDFLTGPSAG